MISASRVVRSAVVMSVVVTGAAGAAADWEAAPSFPDVLQPRKHCVGLNFQGSLVVIGGLPFDGAGDAPVHSLDPGADDWTIRPSLDGSIVRQCAGIDSLGRMIVFAGEFADDPAEDGGRSFRYDFVEGQWNSTGQRSGSAPEDYVACATDGAGHLYSIGGGLGPAASAGEPNSPRVERYDATTNVWTVLAPLPVAVADAAGAYDGQNRVLVFGGFNATASARLAEVQVYDIFSNAWSTTSVPDMPIALTGARAVLGADDRIYVMGGVAGPVAGGTTQTAVYKLDLHTNTWSTGTSMATPRSHFAAARNDEDYIYAMGGENDSGGTHLCERLYTPPCPTLIAQPAAALGWIGGGAGFTVQAVGGGTLTYQWRRGATPLSDGPAPGGGVITGATSSSLFIDGVAAGDAGDYDVLVMNDCGVTTSAAAALTVLEPPFTPDRWDAISLHPAQATTSYGYGVSGGRQVGVAVWVTPPYNLIDHAMMWQGSAESGVELAGPGSVGGAAYSIASDQVVGWWWKPYQCYISGQWLTCYYKAGAGWSASTLEHTNLHTGSEYSFLTDTDSVWHTGRFWYDDASGNVYSTAFARHATTGQVLYFGDYSALPLHASSVNAVDGSRFFGSTYVNSQAHAAAWTTPPILFSDLHPAGATSSWVADAGDNQQVGQASIGGVSHPGLWSGSAASFQNLLPAGHVSGGLNGVDRGVQVGQVDGHAGVWLGSASAFFDLDGVLPPGYTGSSAQDVEVSSDGTVTIIGYAFNTALSRNEAMLWRAAPPPCPGDATGDRVVDFSDVTAVLANWSSAGPAGDADHDGDVEFADVTAVLAAFGVPCP